jgi:hypothetical protein
MKLKLLFKNFSVLETRLFAHLVKKFTSFCGTRRSIPVLFTITCHQPLFKPDKFSPHRHILFFCCSFYYNIFPSTPGSPKLFLS